MERIRFAVHHVGWTDCFSLFLLIVVAAAAFFALFLCVTPTLFVLFARVFALLSPRCRFPLRSSASNLPLFCSLDPVSYYAQFSAQSEWVVPLFRLHLHPPHSDIDVMLSSNPPPCPRLQSYCILYKRV